MQTTVFLSLGGNHNNTLDLLKYAIADLQHHAINPIQTSSFYSSPPWGFSADNDFYKLYNSFLKQV
jgi:7,8-dihydro-6-hydroxymethylpterin-pyrophosphokinase